MGYDMYWEEQPRTPEAAEMSDPPDYFRLNIWGMVETRAAMEQLDMLDSAAWPSFPQLEQFGLDSWPDQYDLDGGTFPYLSGTPEAAFLTEVATVLYGDGGGRIPAYKFCSNDGWLVTPEEIRRSLAIYDRSNAPTPRYAFDAYGHLLGNEIHPELEWWDEWIDYLRAAAAHGGIRVY